MAADGTIADDYLAQAATFWDNPNCTTQIEIVQNGKFDPTRPGTVTFSDGSVSPVTGRLKLSFAYIRFITGDCEAELQMLADCYSNGVGCSQVEVKAAKNLFDLFIRQSGVLNISDAKRVRGLVYEVQFE